MAGESPAFIFKERNPMRFKAIMQGNFGAISVNNRLRGLHERIEALESAVDALTGKKEPVVHDEPTETANSAETVVLENEPFFDWQLCDDVQDLKDYALLELGLTIRGNKKADTVRAEIKGFLETQGA